MATTRNNQAGNPSDTPSQADADAAAAAEAEIQARISAAVEEALAAKAEADAKAKADAEAAAADAPVEISTTVVVQWPQASVLVAEGTGDTVRIPNTRRDAPVEGGWVTLHRGDIIPSEARPDQRALLLEIGAAAGVAFAQPAAAPVEGEPVID